jgi:anti-sigma regulatory factor (Ser/Thr protein kinase)/biotin operon repressor
MSSKEKIIEYLSEHHSASGSELSAYLGISRQAVNKNLKALIQNGEVIKKGTTRDAVYETKKKNAKEKSTRIFEKTYELKNLEEDTVFQEVRLFLNLERELNHFALDIVRYAFTEILNNAIDHSHSGKCFMKCRLDPYDFHFRIRDFGIGVFFSICDKFDLADENAAVGELIKGKTTTKPEKHAGEGLFFTSKVSDKLSLRSHKIDLSFDNVMNDVFIEEKRFLKGTDIFFNISKRSKRSLAKVFNEYSPEEFDYLFNRTRVQVKLFQKQYVSRSEAKRLLHNLDKFTEIIFDFNGVKAIGQGFADEIFRVFKNEHPEIVIKTDNVSPVIKTMIRHVVDN